VTGHEAYEHLATLAVELHPMLEHKAYWEVGATRLPDVFLAISPFSGIFPYQPPSIPEFQSGLSGRLMGWPVKEVAGNEIQLRAEDKGHLWIIR
jgi:hypothetical protein